MVICVFAQTNGQVYILFQRLQTDLSQHRSLVHQLSTEMKALDRQRPPRDVTSAFIPLSEEAIQPRWEALSRELEEKRANLEELIRTTDVSDHCGYIILVNHLI